jgi:hypothetical protein
MFLIVGLGLGVYFTGGSLFSPGELSAVKNGTTEMNGFATHAEFSSDCAQCHAPFAGVDAARCEACHTNIAEDRQTETTLHGRLPDVSACAACHFEHQGEEYDLKTAATANFDHTLTSFSLIRHTLDYQNQPLDCAACHQQEGSFTVSDNACAACHRQEDAPFISRHESAYGTDCLACHDGQDTMASFTPAQHADLFPLTGAHSETACEACHTGGKFSGVPQECEACHAEPEIHMGLFAPTCADCHNTGGFTPAIWDAHPFNHTEDGGFSLRTHTVNFDGRPFTCTTCHGEQQPLAFSEETCVECHRPEAPAFIDDHQNQFGPNCQSCHDGSGRMANFDHSQIWPLEGQHAVQECTACHVDRIFSGTPAECAACHQEPAVHAGLFGQTCNACHTADAWLPARLRYHNFPLDHGEQGQLECAACHTGSYDEYTCTTCHEHNPDQVRQEHTAVDLGSTDLFNCIACHPTGKEDG